MTEDLPQREKTLLEYMQNLPRCHRAHKEFVELMAVAEVQAEQHVDDDMVCHKGILPKEKCCRCSSILETRELLSRIKEFSND